MEPKLFLVFEKNESLCLHMGGYFNNLELQNHLFETLEILKAKEKDILLIDLTKLEVLMNISQVWTNETLIPKAIDHGLKKVGFVLPLTFLDEVDLTNINTSTKEKGLEVKFFDKQDTAFKWLLPA